MGHLLQTTGLTLRYGPIVAVRDVSLDVGQGEIVALLGSNGAGKSTTLSGIVGLLKPAAGSIRFDGEEIGGRSPEAINRLGIALSPEGRRVFPKLSVDDNLRVGGRDRGREAIAASREETFERFPALRDARGKLAGALSGGQQQMLAVGRALMSAPRLLLLDEPSLGLAPAIVDEIFALIENLKAEGMTILLVEQNAGRALGIADRAYVLASGNLLRSGTAEEIADSDIERTYLAMEGS
jgi:branched-chain amino acid transport system ATP-binding protein